MLLTDFGHRPLPPSPTPLIRYVGPTRWNRERPGRAQLTACSPSRAAATPKRTCVRMVQHLRAQAEGVGHEGLGAAGVVAARGAPGVLIEGKLSTIRSSLFPAKQLAATAPVSQLPFWARRALIPFL